MTLGELIEYLEARDPSEVMRSGITKPHSYRGYYNELAFEPARDVTVGDMLAEARGAVGHTFEGYKGGLYRMDLDTDCHLAHWGHTGSALTPACFELDMLPDLLRNAAAGVLDETEEGDLMLLAADEIERLRHA